MKKFQEAETHESECNLRNVAPFNNPLLLLVNVPSMSGLENGAADSLKSLVFSHIFSLTLNADTQLAAKSHSTLHSRDSSFLRICSVRHIKN
jgi:hypothetical protein